MRYTKHFQLVILLICILSMVGLAQNKKDTKPVEWSASDMEVFGFNDYKPYPKVEEGSKIIPEGFVYIKGGTFTTGSCPPIKYTHDDSTLWAEPNSCRISIVSFIMKETEVTNREYREFVHWVRDSIARELLYNSDNPWAQYYKIVDDDGNIQGLDWNEQIDWADTVSLASMFIPPDLRFFGIMEHNTDAFKYKMNNTEVSVYPDTLCWIYNVPYNDYLAINYFWHPDFDNYPVVGVSIEQAQAFCHWKTKMEWSHEKPFGYYRLPTAAEYEFAVIQPVDKMNNENHYRKEIFFSGNKINKYNYSIGWNNSDSIATDIPTKEKHKEKYYHRVLNNNTTFLTSFNTGGIFSNNGMHIIKDNADGFSFTSPVGFYAKNHEGLYDLQGNVAEWTSSVFYPYNVIYNAINYLIDFFPILSIPNYYSIPDDLQEKFYEAKNSIDFLKILSSLKIKYYQTTEPDVNTFTETIKNNVGIQQDDGKIRFTKSFSSNTIETHDSISFVPVGRIYLDDSIYIAVPIDSITNRDWIKNYIEISKTKLVNSISDKNKRIEYCKKIDSDTYALFDILDRIDDLLIRSKRLNQRNIVKGGSWAHNFDHTNPYLNHCLKPNQTRSYVGFRYVATVLGSTN